MPNFQQFPDDKVTSRILNRSFVARVNFDPKKSKHRDSLKRFLETGNWGEVQFFAEAPYVTVPETVLRKMAASALKSSG